MTFVIRTACVTSLVVLSAISIHVGHAQAPPPTGANGATPAAAVRAPASNQAQNSVFVEDGPVETGWDLQFESLWHAMVRLPAAALLSAVLAFRPRRRGTPKRQAPVIQTQIILAIVGAAVMLVVGASLARAFGIVGAAGLIRYRAKVRDPKDAGVMLATLAIGLASGVGLYLFAVFATFFVLGVLWVIESIDPEPFVVFDLAITTKDSASVKESIEGVLRRRHILFELRSTSDEEISYQVKLPLNTDTDKVSDALMSLHGAQAVNVKWEEKKEPKPS